MTGEFSVKSGRVLAEMREVSKLGAQGRRKWAHIVREDVEGQASENEIGDGELITDDEPLSDDM